MFIGSRVGHLRLTFEGSSRPYVLIEASRASVQGSADLTNLTFPYGSVQISSNAREVTGYNMERQDRIIGPNPATRFAGYFCARFDQDILEWGTASNGDGRIYPGRDKKNGEQVSAYVLFAEDVKTVNARVGVSFISVDQARQNLENEIPDGVTLEDTARRTRLQWAEKLDRVKIEGAGVTEDDKKVFYTGIFHSLQVCLVRLHCLALSSSNLL